MEFADRATRDLFNGVPSPGAQRLLPAALRQKALDKLTVLDSVTELDQLRVPAGNRLEALRGDRVGQDSIRINDQYRICFVWTGGGAVDVEIIDYHS